MSPGQAAASPTPQGHLLRCTKVRHHRMCPYLCVWQCSRAPVLPRVGVGHHRPLPQVITHSLSHTVSPSHLPSPSHTQPPLSHHQPHCHTFSHTQSCTATPSASNTACHTLSPRCRPQKYRHSLSDAGHTCLQPHRLIPRHADPDTLPPPPCVSITLTSRGALAYSVPVVPCS